MAEDTLVKDALTDRRIAAGQALTDALEKHGWPFEAAFWLYEWETNRWRYALVSQDADHRFMDALGEIFAILDKTEPQLSIFDFHFVSPRDRYAEELLRMTRNAPIPRDRVLRGPLIEDSYVYRVHHSGAR